MGLPEEAAEQLLIRATNGLNFVNIALTKPGIIRTIYDPTAGPVDSCPPVWNMCMS